jgi:hypothetical protein
VKSMKIRGPFLVSVAIVLAFTAAAIAERIEGMQAAGSAVAGNPVQVGGSDGTNVQPIKVSTSGVTLSAASHTDGTSLTTANGLKVQGAAANAATAAGNPVRVCGVDSAGNARDIPIRSGAATADYGLPIMGQDNGLVARFLNVAIVGQQGNNNSLTVGGVDTAGKNQALSMDTSGRVAIAGYDTANAVIRALPVSSAGAANSSIHVAVGGQDGSNARPFLTDTNGSMSTAHYNGSAVERDYGNYQATGIASTTYNTATTTNGSDLTNFNARGIAVHFDVTSFTAAGTSTTVNLQAKAGSDYLTVYTFTPTLAGTGLKSFCVYPGAASAGSWSSAPVQGPVPRTFRVQVVTVGTVNYVATVYVDFLN